MHKSILRLQYSQTYWLTFFQIQRISAISGSEGALNDTNNIDTIDITISVQKLNSDAEKLFKNVEDLLEILDDDSDMQALRRVSLLH